MFDQIFGNYLVETGEISLKQMIDGISSARNTRVKLGTIAIAEKMMTPEQAEEVNHLQTVMDCRFGDIAIEKGYLTDEQVGNLLKKQGNPYMALIESLISLQCVTYEKIEACLKKYQEQNGFSNSDMDDLISCDIDRVVRLFLPSNEDLADRHCALAIRTLTRIINSGAYVSKAYLTDELPVDNLALQKLQGDHQITTAFAGSKNALLSIACPFADEEFETVDLDALDAVGEFINCINGLFASEVSKENMDLDMLPPEFYEKATSVKGNQFCVFPITIGNNSFCFIQAIDSTITIA